MELDLSNFDCFVIEFLFLKFYYYLIQCQQVAREERPATGYSPLKDFDDPDSIVGSFDLLSREECSPRFCPADVALRDTLETVEAR